ncbi:hypothetical protein [Streptomyces sp. DHE17-7]|uniref:hypothetical protein n=1 Tax=Streptomyces sp. DHE17-7 TaxID=2759949 RepID=UPI003FA71C34
MSAALKRRFNFETVGPIPDLDAETALVRSQARASVERAGAPFTVDEAVLEALVVAFRDLRESVSRQHGRERPSHVIEHRGSRSRAWALRLALP